jgi:hypothetical protein
LLRENEQAERRPKTKSASPPLAGFFKHAIPHPRHGQKTRRPEGFSGNSAIRSFQTGSCHAANLHQKPKTTYPSIPCIPSIPLFFQKSDFGGRKTRSEDEF